MTDISNRSRVQAGVPTGGEFATEARDENEDLPSYNARTAADAIEHMIRQGELSPAARDMDPQEAIEQWGEANAATVWEVQERLDAAGLYLRLPANKLTAGDAVDLTPIIEKYGDPNNSDSTDYDASLYEMATLVEDPEIEGYKLILHTDQGSWAVSYTEQVKAQLLPGHGRCETCGEPDHACTCETDAPARVLQHTTDGNGVNVIWDKSTGNTFNGRDDWGYFYDSNGEGHRDPEDGPAEITQHSIAFLSHGLRHRDPEDGPATISRDGHVNYSVNGKPFTPSDELLKRHGVKKTDQGYFLKNHTRAKFAEIQRGYAAGINTEDPWA